MSKQKDSASVENENFDDVTIGKRDFMRLAAATTGTLLAPGQAVGGEGERSSQKMTEVYQYLVNHTPLEDQIQTLITFSDASGFDALNDIEGRVRTTKEPTTAAYAELTPKQAKKIAEKETVVKIQFSPGANPFWRLNQYQDSVFPPVDESVGLIDFEEMVQGMEYLTEEYSNQTKFYSIGESRGLYNFVTQQRESRNIWIAEVTNNINDTDQYKEKTKVLIFNQDSDERQGPEGMFRFFEDLLRGEEADIATLLDEIVLVFMIANPDGWASKRVQYFSGEKQTEDGIERINQYLTVPPGGADPNRSYPTPGYYNPEHFPAESHGSDLTDDMPGVDDDVPEYVRKKIPAPLEIADHFRTREYENLDYAVDLHGMGSADSFLEGFPLNGNYDPFDLHDLYQLQRTVEDEVDATNLEERVQSTELQNIFGEINAEYAQEDDEQLPTPTETYKYGTLFDILGYSTTGDGISWMSAAEENGGLGDIRTFATETVYSIGRFVPSLTEAWVVANKAVIRATAKHAAEQTAIEVNARSGGTGYVGSETLTRSSEDLGFTQTNSRQQTTFNRQTKTVSLTPSQAESTTVELSSDVDHLSVKPLSSAVSMEVRDPDDAVAMSMPPMQAAHGGFARPTEQNVPNPAAGEWSVDVTAVDESAPAEVDVTISTMKSKGDSPDPMEVLGFQQRDYEVTPFQFFDEYAQYLTNPSFTEFSVDAICDGALETNAKGIAVENLVVNHDDGIDNSEYIESLEQYTNKGGNLVLTDRGINLLGAMTNELTAPITPDDIRTEMLFTSFIGERNEDHQLLAGSQPSQQEVGKFVPLGYSIGDDVPMTLLDPATFECAGGEIAGTTAGKYKDIDPGVAAGSLQSATDSGQIHVIGGLLPAASQDHLHPFGMNEYSISFLGLLLIGNALGHRQSLTVGGETTFTADPTSDK